MKVIELFGLITFHFNMSLRKLNNMVYNKCIV